MRVCVSSEADHTSNTNTVTHTHTYTHAPDTNTIVKMYVKFGQSAIEVGLINRGLVWLAPTKFQPLLTVTD